MTPDELLRLLLDSRWQTTGLSPNETADSTRIRTLDTLCEEELSVRALADRLRITRQTAYRALNPLEEAGLIRAGNGRFTVTCSGEAVRRAYHEICNEVDRSGLVQLARSMYKQWVLRTLKRTPSRKATLAAQARREDGPSRTTIHRVLTDFTDDGYVRERPGAYELTETGSRLLAAYTDFRAVVSQALDKRAILRWLPSTLDFFPIEALDEARVIQNSPDQPHNVLSAFIQCADTDVEVFRWMATIASPALLAAYRPLLQSSRTDVRIVSTEPVLAAFTTNQATTRELRTIASVVEADANAGGETIRFVTDPLPVHLVICDDTRVILEPAPSTGVTDATTVGIESSDPAIVGWATNFFESWYVRGKSPDTAIFNRAKKHDAR